jgi:hypothetical protein
MNGGLLNHVPLLRTMQKLKFMSDVVSHKLIAAFTVNH